MRTQLSRAPEAGAQDVARVKPKWLGTDDRYARLRRIEKLNPETDFREITELFYGDFRSVMITQSFSGFMLTFAAPRMSRILSSTGELEHRVAKRVVDTALLARSVVEHGTGAGAGREAAWRVSAMHRHYDIHKDDFVVVGCDAALVSLRSAQRYGWRPVTEPEYEAVRLFHNRQARAFGSRQSLPPSIALMEQYYAHYLDTELRFEPQNLRLAQVLLNHFRALVPKAVRPIISILLLGVLDPRITRACGLRVPSKAAVWAAHAAMRLLGRQDPVPDGGPDMMAPMVRAVYPDGWKMQELGTHTGAHVPSTPEQSSH